MPIDFAHDTIVELMQVIGATPAQRNLKPFVGEKPAIYKKSSIGNTKILDLTLNYTSCNRSEMSNQINQFKGSH